MRSNPCWRILVAIALLMCLLLSGCAAASKQFQGDRAYSHVVAQCELGPRPVGSEAGAQTAEYIMEELTSLGWAVQTQEFVFRGVVGRNVVAVQGRGPVVILGAHYDTRSLANRDPLEPTSPVLGANDGASGVAVLLELARVVDINRIGLEVWLVFFDAEDQGGINGWPFSVGASYMAQQLAVVPQAVVVVDMVGDKDQRFLWEGYSDPQLLRRLWAVAADLGYDNFFVSENGSAIMDDHVPFLQRGFAAVDIIDLDYPYWHTTEDTLDKVSPASLERVGRVLQKWLEDYTTKALRSGRGRRRDRAT